MNIAQKIRNGLADMIRIGKITAVDKDSTLQKVTVDVRAGVVDTKVTRMQNYGFFSTPDTAGDLLGVEITCNGNRFVVVLDDLTAPPEASVAGDVMMWHKEGHFIRMTKEKIIDVECETLNVKATTTNWEGDINHTGNQTHIGDTDQTGTHTATVDVIAQGRSLVHHDHDYYPGPLPETQTGEANA